MPNPYRLDLSFACAPVTLAADTAPGKVRFTGIAYSGGVIPQYGPLGDVAINLSSLQNPDAVDVPVLIDHNAQIDSIAGKGTLSRVGAALHITGELTTATEAGRQISALMAEGYPLQMSVGMQANMRQTAAPETVNGQTMSVNHIFEHARIVEVSFVPTGADPNTSAAQFSAVPVQSPVTVTMKGVAMTRTPEDQALIDSLQTQITTFTEQIAALQAAQVESATAARTAELGALFTEIGRDLPADIKPYIAMGADSFTAYAADLRANKPAPRDRALFSAQSVSMGNNIVPDAGDKTGALLASVKKLAAARLQTA